MEERRESGEPKPEPVRGGGPDQGSVPGKPGGRVDADSNPRPADSTAKAWWKRDWGSLAPIAVAFIVHRWLFKGEDLLDSTAVGVLSLVVVWAGLQMLRLLYRLRWWLLAALVLVGGCSAAIVLPNLYCVVDEDGDLGDSPSIDEEDLLCFVLGVAADELEPLPSGEFLAAVDSPGPSRTEWIAEARASVPLPDASPDGGIGEAERIIFNRCLAQLYEDPAVEFAANVAAQGLLDVDLAEDAAMDALLSVCERAMKTQVGDLRPYFFKAAANRVRDYQRLGKREATCEEVAETAAPCWTDRMVFLRGEQQRFDEARCQLTPTQAVTVQRWLGGGSWKEIGADTGQSPRDAANAFNSALRKMNRHIESRVCTAP